MKKATSNDPYLANDMAPVYRGSLDDVRPGTICTLLANTSRFVESNFDVPLTTFATGWRDSNPIAAALEFVAPMVSVGRRFTFAQATNSEAFISEQDDVRGIGADFKRVEYTSSKVLAETYNKGLMIRIDKDEVNDMPDFETIYTGRLMTRLLRNELRRAIGVLALAVQTNTNYVWTDPSNTDPDMDLTDAIERYIGVTGSTTGAGVHPNRALFAKFAWNNRLRALRSNNNPGGYLSSNQTPEQLAAFLGLDSIYISNERFTTGGRLAPTKTPVVGPTTGAAANSTPVFIYLAEAGQTTEDPSNIKRFVIATEGGTPFRVFVEPKGSKFVEITVEHYSNIVATSTVGVQQLTVSQS